MRSRRGNRGESFGQRAASCWQRRQLALTIGRKCHASSNVGLGQVWELRKQLLVGHTGSEIFEIVRDGHSRAADARLAAALARFNRDDVSIVHAAKRIV